MGQVPKNGHLVPNKGTKGDLVFWKGWFLRLTSLSFCMITVSDAQLYRNYHVILWRHSNLKSTKIYQTTKNRLLQVIKCGFDNPQPHLMSISLHLDHTNTCWIYLEPFWNKFRQISTLVTMATVKNNIFYRKVAKQAIVGCFWNLAIIKAWPMTPNDS